MQMTSWSIILLLRLFGGGLLFLHNLFGQSNTLIMTFSFPYYATSGHKSVTSLKLPVRGQRHETGNITCKITGVLQHALTPINTH